MSQEGLKPAKGGSSEAGITIENGALVIDNPSKISAVDSALSENYSETDTLEKGKQDDKPNNAYQRYGSFVTNAPVFLFALCRDT
jgi:hypothetical protein